MTSQTTSFHAGGMTGISRWSSEARRATPPEIVINKTASRRDARWISFFVAALALATSATAQTFQLFAVSDCVPDGLLVNGVANPLAVERDTVRFTWRLSCGARGASQTAYQIRIATTPARLAQPDIWDSGKVPSSQSASVEYTGPKLPPATRLWWDVRVWAKTAASPKSSVQSPESGVQSPESPPSAPAFFDTGLSHSDWTARYIWDGTTNINNFAYFRKTFTLPANKPLPALAKVYVTAHNDYLLYLNNHPVGRGPGRCDPYRYGLYNSYNITPLLRPGSNTFAVLARWHGTWNNNGVNGAPAFLLEARLLHADGTTQTIATDATWKTLPHTGYIETAPVFFSPDRPRPPRPDATRPEPTGGWITQLDDPVYAASTVIIRDGPRNIYAPYGGAAGSRNRPAIQFDAQQDPANWRSPDYDDTAWPPATIVDRSDYHLYAQMAPLQREQSELLPTKITRDKTTNTYLVDFDRCITGWPKLTLRANRPGDKVRIEYFQRTDQRNPAGWDEYTCRGGEETWEPNFGRYTSFQVLKITGYIAPAPPASRVPRPSTPESGVRSPESPSALQPFSPSALSSDIRAIWSYCDADVAGRFHCSSDLLNSIYTLCERSARQNTQYAIIAVDANREQSQWTADAWNIGNVLLYNHRNTTIIDKIIRDYAAQQLPNGNFPACAPAQRSRCIPEWSMYWPMLLWQQYLFSGDEHLLREMTPRLTRFMAWLKNSQSPETHLINPPGWRISEYAGGKLPNGGYNIATNSQYYETLRIASRISAVLGDSAQADTYARQSREVRDAINARLFNPKGNYYLAKTDSSVEKFPLASAWPLRFNIVPDETRAAVVASITAAPNPNLGGYGGDAFYSALLSNAAGAYAVRDLARYNKMLTDNHANWESFASGEVNHAWTAYPAYLFPKYILGIQPTSGGFATFDVRPETNGLTYAEGTVPTVKGDITTRWEKTADGRFTLTLTVPPNTRASVYIPKPAANFTLTESGKPLWPEPAKKIPGVIRVFSGVAFIKCEVAAGKYEFVTTTNP